MVAAGTWVEVQRTLLEPEQRSSALPEETRTCPYVLRMSGFLTAEAEIGDQVTITSMIGREHEGTLVTVNPSYAHTFGETVPELLHIGLSDDPSLPEFTREA